MLRSVVIVIVVVVKTFHFSVFRPREAARPENGKMKCLLGAKFGGNRMKHIGMTG